MPRAVSAPSSRMRLALPPPAAESHANTVAVEAVATAVTISASRTPPIWASTGRPAGISATAEPRPTAANTAPNPAGPRPNAFWMSTPMAGRPNCTTETAAWAMTAMISVVRGRGLIATRYPGLGGMYAPTGVVDRTHPMSDLRERASVGRDRRAGRHLGFGAAGGRAAGLRVR